MTGVLPSFRYSYLPLDLVPAYAETDQINVPNAEIQPAYAGDSDKVR